MRHSDKGICDRSICYFCLMIHVSILVLRNAVPASITDSVDVFEWVNAFYLQQKKDIPFHIELLGFTREVKLNAGKYIISTDRIFNEVEKTNLIIVPSFTGHAGSATYINKDCVVWLA